MERLTYCQWTIRHFLQMWQGAPFPEFLPRTKVIGMRTRPNLNKSARIAMSRLLIEFRLRG